MKSILTKLATSLVLLAVFFAPLQGIAPVARAQSAADTAAIQQAGMGGVPGTPGAATAAGTPAAPLGVQNPTTAQAATNNPTTGRNDGSGDCGFWSGTNWSVCLSNVVYVFTVGVMSAFAYVGGFVLDYALQITLNSATYAQSFLTQGWAAVRDIANMAFIFILVYIAITIVLKVETSGTLKALASVVVMALLINFSFFFTRVIIDAGNILAVQFYNAIPAPALANAGQQGTVTGTVGAAANAVSPSGGATKDLTAVIMQATGVTQILGTGSFSAAFLNRGGGATGVGTFLTNLIVFCFIYVTMGIMLAILAMVFVGAGVKFIIRSVILWFLIIAAPLAFIAQAFNGANKSIAGYFKKWLTMLVEFAFFPAFFLFMFWIINLFALQMGGSCTAAGNTNCGLIGAVFNDFATANASSGASGAGFTVLTGMIASVGIRLGILIAMLWFSMKLSDSFAKQGSSLVHKATGKMGGMAKSYGNWWGSRAQRVAVGTAILPVRGAGIVYRDIIGRGANNLKKTMAGSRFWNKEPKGLVNSAINLARSSVTNRILEPVAASSITKSIDSFKKADEARKARKTETIKNIRTLDNKDTVKDLAKIATQFDEAKFVNLSNKITAEKDLATLNSTFDATKLTSLTARKDIDKNLADATTKINGFLNKITATSPLSSTEQAALIAEQARKTQLQADQSRIGAPLTPTEETERAKLESTKAQITALQPQVQQNPISATDRSEFDVLTQNKLRITELAGRVNGFSKAELEAALPSVDSIKSVMKNLNENTMKKLQESDKYSDANKEEMQKKWHEESFDAPLQKIAALLRKIEKSLSANGVSTTNLLAKNQTINSQSINKIVDKLKESIEIQRTLRQGTKDEAEKIAAGVKIANLQDTMREAGKVTEHFGKASRSEIVYGG